MKAFHCYEPKSRRNKLVPLIASLSAFEFFYDIKPKDSDADSSDDVSKLAHQCQLNTRVHANLETIFSLFSYE